MRYGVIIINKMNTQTQKKYIHLASSFKRHKKCATLQLYSSFELILLGDN